jgi:hypothetical protein
MGNVTITTGGGQGAAGIGGADAGAAAGFGNAQQASALAGFRETPSKDTADAITKSFEPKKNPTDDDLKNIGMNPAEIDAYKKAVGGDKKAEEAKKAGGGGGAKEDPMEELIKKLMKGPPPMSREAATAKAKELTEKAGGDPAKALKELEASQKGAEAGGANGAASPGAAGASINITTSGAGAAPEK